MSLTGSSTTRYVDTLAFRFAGLLIRVPSSSAANSLSDNFANACAVELSLLLMPRLARVGSTGDVVLPVDL